MRIDLPGWGRYVLVRRKSGFWTYMLEAIEKLLVLQDRDGKLSKLNEELAHIPLERQQLQSKVAASQAQLEALKTRLKQLESERKQLELQVEEKKELIGRYSGQQYQTKKNEEYRALAHEIDTCQHEIVKLEDQELELMEQADTAQHEAAKLSQSSAGAKQVIDARLADLAGREANLKKELANLEANREELARAVEESARRRYERLLRQRGQNVVVGIEHGVCGGCHMQLSRQIVVDCRAEQELVTCPNCSRLLYYTSDMDVAVVE
jgi:predicted  nucleic acid-binding Zn-ribbon protein